MPAVLVQFLVKRGVECHHVLDVGLSEASDADICRYAAARDLIVVSKDEDFLYLADQLDTRIKLLWVRLGNFRTSGTAQVSRRSLGKD
jgi:predicted nuclease of predicted toxin-antitoxin system